MNWRKPANRARFGPRFLSQEDRLVYCPQTNGGRIAYLRHTLSAAEWLERFRYAGQFVWLMLGRRGTGAGGDGARVQRVSGLSRNVSSVSGLRGGVSGQRVRHHAELHVGAGVGLGYMRRFGRFFHIPAEKLAHVRGWFGLARLYLLEGKFEQAASWAQKTVNSGQANEVRLETLGAVRARNLSEESRRRVEPLPPNSVE